MNSNTANLKYLYAQPLYILNRNVVISEMFLPARNDDDENDGKDHSRSNR